MSGSGRGMGSMSVLHPLADVVACSGMTGTIDGKYDDCQTQALHVSFIAFQCIVRAVLRGAVLDDRIVIVVVDFCGDQCASLCIRVLSIVSP